MHSTLWPQLAFCPWVEFYLLQSMPLVSCNGEVVIFNIFNIFMYNKNLDNPIIHAREGEGKKSQFCGAFQVRCVWAQMIQCVLYWMYLDQTAGCSCLCSGALFVFLCQLQQKQSLIPTSACSPPYTVIIIKTDKKCYREGFKNSSIQRVVDLFTLIIWSKRH